MAGRFSTHKEVLIEMFLLSVTTSHATRDVFFYSSELCNLLWC